MCVVIVAGIYLSSDLQVMHVQKAKLADVV